MVEIIRFVGVLNAGAWFGSLLFFTIAAGPAFFSPDMMQLLGRPHAGAAAQVVINRLFILQCWFAAIAILQLLIVWIYTQRPIHRPTTILMGIIVALVLIGGSYLSPKLKLLHLQKYAIQSSPAQKAEAARSFSTMHGVAQSANLVVIGGVLFYFWHLYRQTPNGRFVPSNKFRTPSNGPGG